KKLGRFVKKTRRVSSSPHRRRLPAYRSLCVYCPEKKLRLARYRGRASRRQKTLACEIAKAVSKPRDGGGLRPSGKCRPKRCRKAGKVWKRKPSTRRVATS